jgi:Fic family protein
MRIPIKPPSVTINGERILEIVRQHIGPLTESKYRHWDTLRHRSPPDGLTVEEWWWAMKFARSGLYRQLPLQAVGGAPFVYAPVEPIYRMLHGIDKNATGMIGSPDQVTNPETRDYYLVSSLMEESITSSQLEGASTTRKVAKAMLAEGRKPRDRNERMIFNNYEAMRHIRSAKKQPLTPALVLEIQRILTVDAIDEPDGAGRLRREDEPIVVTDDQGQVLHTPPAAQELKARMAAMCAFANAQDESPELFLHPVLRSILLHFWLAYDHPFVDGNGRTARALFYWSMARQGYWLSEYVSISRILKKAPSRYARAFLYTETDENDLTYFLLYQLDVIQQAIRELMRFLEAKAREINETRALLREIAPLRDLVNHRQVALLTHALDHPMATYSVETHRRVHGVTTQTARTDLTTLAEIRVLEQSKSGRKFIFSAPEDLRERLASLAQRRRSRRRNP